MNTTTTTSASASPTGATSGTTPATAGPTPHRGPAIAGIGFWRLVLIELRKMFDTRSGFWLMASIVIVSVLATGVVILWAPEAAQTYDTFAAAIGFPMAVILPVVAILSVTSEWSQRSGLTTFALVPHRGRVIGAKAVGSLVVAVASMVIAFTIGALGNLLGAAIAGTDLVWDIPLTGALTITLGNVIGLMVGFMLGVLIRNSAGAVVAYFVYAFVLPTVAEVLAVTQQWFADIRGWVDPNFAQAPLFDAGGASSITTEQWAQLGATTMIWVVLPLIVGLVLVRRSEVK